MKHNYKSLTKSQLVQTVERLERENEIISHNLKQVQHGIEVAEIDNKYKNKLLVECKETISTQRMVIQLMAREIRKLTHSANGV